MLKINLLIFDLDGTLVDTREDIALAVNRTLKKFGFNEKSIDEISKCVGGGFEETIRKVFGYKNYQSEVLPVFKEFYSKFPVVYSELYPNVREVMMHFKDKKKCIITNKNKSISEDIIRKLGISGYFDIVIGGDDYEQKKPAPYAVLKILKEQGISNDRAIMIGDMSIDIQTAKNSGIYSCAVTYGIGDTRDIIKEKPDFIIDDLMELIGLFK